MTNHEINNSVNLDDVILWQYQHADNLKALVAAYDDFFDKNVRQFHDDWRDKVFNLEESYDEQLNKFALSVWGILLGYSRPQYTDESGNKAVVSDDFYRRLLKARFRVMRSNSSIPAIVKYLQDVFGGDVMMDDTADMALHYSIKYPNSLSEEENAILSQDPDSVLVYPAGVKTNEPIEEIVFGFEGQQPQAETDPDVGGLDDSTFINDHSISAKSNS